MNPPIHTIDIVIVIVGVIVGNIVFRNFEKHLPIARRVLKHGALLSVLVVVGVLFGRIVFYGILLVLTVGQFVLHAWYFPKHGVNGLTAEPHERYLNLINAMKSQDRQPPLQRSKKKHRSGIISTDTKQDTDRPFGIWRSKGD